MNPEQDQIALKFVEIMQKGRKCDYCHNEVDFDEAMCFDDEYFYIHEKCYKDLEKGKK